MIVKRAFVVRCVGVGPGASMTVYFKDMAEAAATSSPVIDKSSARRQGFYAKYGKRTFDIVCVLATAPVTLPLIAMLAVLVALDGGKPFYIQPRVGLGKRSFSMFKLRSMVRDADARLSAYLESTPTARVEWERDQKLKNDPRITRLGRFIRRTSLDELPQLINVLIGDMSLVGPRPIMESQKILYRGERYSQVRPGITGAWQISDRNNCAFSKRVEFDDEYVANLSFREDLNVLFKTIGAVTRCTGY